MAPPNPKRPPRPPRPPGQQATKEDPAEELPFDDDEVAPLQADDPRPQRVPQYPAGSRRVKRRGPGERSKSDRELSPRYDWQKEYSDPGLAPAFLYVERGPGAGQLVPLHQGSITLGRSSTSDLRLQHASISRRHAQLTRRGNAFAVRDLGSQNGTFVNRSRIKGEVEIQPGDELSLGNAMLRLRGSGPSPAVIKTTLDPIRTRAGKRPVGVVVVALAAAVVGSAVAAVISLVAMRMTETSPARSATSAKGAGTPAPAKEVQAVGAGTGGESPGPQPSGVAVPSATGERAVDVKAGLAAPASGVTDAVPTQPTSLKNGEAPSATGIARDEHGASAPASAADIARGQREGTSAAKASETLSATDIARGQREAPPVTKAGETLSAADIARGQREAPTAAKATETPSATDIAKGQRGTSAKAVAHDPEAPDVARGTAQASAGPRATGRKPLGDGAPGNGPPGALTRENILSRYESGDVAGALAQARRANLPQLVQQLTRFQTAESAARAALAQQDPPRALDALLAAVRLDQELSQGWSRQGIELRRQLAGLYVRSGLDAVRASRWAEARGAFNEALKHDASNAQARAQLAALDGQGSPPGP
ncbi:FHA domain-containing protein [Corallococcus soli]|uniref:FHA domain-containing protein n=1 Tax=Corallococcus soli TaxID=2710757 RepID=UPI001D0596CE|nr:FHA domain-containing protein [Corallococcus soli]